MDNFQYKLQIDKLSKMTTQKAIEAFIREHAENAPEYFWNFKITKQNLNTNANIYRCLALGFKMYSGSKGLPQFLENKLVGLHGKFAEYFIDCHESTYDEMLTVFEYDTVVETLHYQPSDYRHFIDIIGTHIPHFSINLKPVSSTPYSHVLSEMTNGQNVGLIMELETLKREVYNNKQFTVLEKLLNIAYSRLSSNVNKDYTKSTKLLEDMAKSLQTVISKHP